MLSLQEINWPWSAEAPKFAYPSLTLPGMSYESKKMLIFSAIYGHFL